LGDEVDVVPLVVSVLAAVKVGVLRRTTTARVFRTDDLGGTGETLLVLTLMRAVPNFRRGAGCQCAVWRGRQNQNCERYLALLLQIPLASAGSSDSTASSSTARTTTTTKRAVAKLFVRTEETSISFGGGVDVSIPDDDDDNNNDYPERLLPFPIRCLDDECMLLPMNETVLAD